jgi:hypothetical protein
MTNLGFFLLQNCDFFTDIGKFSEGLFAVFAGMFVSFLSVFVLRVCLRFQRLLLVMPALFLGKGCAVLYPVFRQNPDGLPPSLTVCSCMA